MRQRFDQADQFDTTEALERLRDALAVLERHVEHAIGAPRGTAPPRERDIAAIRARQGTLDRARRADGTHAQGLRRDIGRLRDDVGRQIKASAGGFDALRDEIRSGRPGGASVDAPGQGTLAWRPGSSTLDGLRSDVEQLKTEVTALAREDSVRDLNDRWSAIERDIARLPHELASRDDMTAMTGRFDALQRTMAALPRSAQLDTLERHLHALAGAVEQVARQSAAAGPPPLEELEARLDEISRAVAAIPGADPSTANANALERMEARIASLAVQIDDYARSHAPVDYDARFAELADRIDRLGAGCAPGAVSGEAMDSLNARIDVMADVLENLVRSEGLSGDQARLASAEMEERLASIDTQLRQTGQIAERSVQQVVRSVDDRMADIARRIDAGRQAEPGAPSIAQFEHRLDEIAAMLASGAAARPPADIAALEAQLADIAASLAPERTAPVDEETIWTAARTAAEEVAARVAAPDEPRMPDTLGQLTDDLRALETLARDTDGRNAKTFEAIHDTLLQVVDHLSSLEEKVRQGLLTAPVAAPSPSGRLDAPPATAVEPMRIDETPPLAADLDGHASAEQASRGAASPAEAAVEAALHALGEMRQESDRPAALAAAGGRGLFRSVAKRLPLGRSRGAGAPGEPDADRTGTDGLGPPVIDDQPIEPFGEKLALADIMARVRTQRPSANPASGAGASASDVGKSDFIAAARRAAQAAAADASIMANGHDGESAGASGSMGSLLSRRRKPIVMATGAILLAIMAIPLVRGLLGPAPQGVAVDTMPPPAITEKQPAGAPVADGQTSVANAPEPAREAPRQATAASEPSAAIANGAVEEAAASVDVDAPPDPDADTGTRTDAGADPLEARPAGFDDVPDRIGPIVLREAAAGGDARALYVVADRIATEAGNDAGALAQAFKWYERSAQRGFAPAQYRLGGFFEKGFGTARDLTAAKTWYQLAAEQGNASAMHNLAVLFASDTEGAPDFDSAARWFLRAAELGVRDSQFNLGILSAKGQGLPLDLGQSYKWFALAARSGDEDAAAKRDDIAGAMRPEQLEQARGEAALWTAEPADPAVNAVNVPDAWRTDAIRTAQAPALSDEEMRRAVANIQAILNDQGYDAGPVDGVMGDRTRNAIVAFQRDNGLSATGDVDQALVEKLLAIADREGR